MPIDAAWFLIVFGVAFHRLDSMNTASVLKETGIACTTTIPLTVKRLAHVQVAVSSDYKEPNKVSWETMSSHEIQGPF